MAELVEPGLGVAAWADLASVRRTIEWVGLDQDRLQKSKFTGATVGRLLRRIVDRHAPEGEIVAQLEAMTALMGVRRRRRRAASGARGCHAQRPRGLVSIGELLGDTIWNPRPGSRSRLAGIGGVVDRKTR